MTTEEFKKEHEKTLKKIKDLTAKENKKYSVLANKYIDANCNVKKGVYELVEENKRRKHKRIVIYGRDIVFGELIRVYGWWLNEKTNIPEKWDTIIVFGCGNPTALKLSDNQKAEKHPDSIKK